MYRPCPIYGILSDLNVYSQVIIAILGRIIICCYSKKCICLRSRPFSRMPFSQIDFPEKRFHEYFFQGYFLKSNVVSLVTHTFLTQRFSTVLRLPQRILRNRSTWTWKSSYTSLFTKTMESTLSSTRKTNNFNEG